VTCYKDVNSIFEKLRCRENYPSADDDAPTELHCSELSRVQRYVRNLRNYRSIEAAAQELGNASRVPALSGGIVFTGARVALDEASASE
jgi:hypothetical protein